MKMRKLILLPALALLLTGCNNGPKTPSKYDPSNPKERDFKINCYLDYNHYDPDNPYYVAWWDFDVPFSKDDIQLKDPDTVPDPFYPVFKGWSRHALVDEDQYLFDFNTPISEEEAVGGYIELFGIFVGE
ncbi:MAG: hypothetical protein E7181_01240 [Erysipelotrichaceae bacterium]|jgi:hypothetical protein|nr:hypothetical protein [Erysipelotrichaceae bacterium]